MRGSFYISSPEDDSWTSSCLHLLPPKRCVSHRDVALRSDHACEVADHLQRNQAPSALGPHCSVGSVMGFCGVCFAGSSAAGEQSQIDGTSFGSKFEKVSRIWTLSAAACTCGQRDHQSWTRKRCIPASMTGGRCFAVLKSCLGARVGGTWMF